MRTLHDIVTELDDIRLAYANDPPRRSSKWYPFSKVFNIGVKDLDNIAYDLGYRQFRRMEREGTPKELFEKHGELQFFKALRDTSLRAYGMNNRPLRQAIQRL